MTDWKAVERSFAKKLGGRRVGILSKEDIMTQDYSYEIKVREKLPEFLKKAYKQAVGNSFDGKIPILVLKEKYKQYKDSLVILSLEDFQELINRGSK